MKNQNEIEKKLKAFDDLNQSKWMRYEDNIIKYYYKSLQEWLDNGMIKPSVTAFTSGLGRDIARLMEEAKQKGFNHGILKAKDEIIKIIDKLNPVWQMKVIEEYDIHTPRDLFIEDFVKELKQKISKEIK